MSSEDMGITARDIIPFEDEDLFSGINGQERRRGQTTDPGADTEFRLLLQRILWAILGNIM
jgi:hypothetical protein